jgi:hypothetical protein
MLMSMLMLLLLNVDVILSVLILMLILDAWWLGVFHPPFSRWNRLLSWAQQFLQPVFAPRGPRKEGS